MRPESGSTTSSGLPSDRLTEAGYVYINRYSWCKYMSYFRTAFGILTVFVTFSTALSSLFSITAFPLGVYLFVVSIPMFLLEFGKPIRLFCGTNGPLCQVFGFVLTFDRWKRGLFYAVLAVVCFFPSITTTWGRITGCLIFLSGVLYVGKCYQKKKVSTFVVDPASSTPSSASARQEGF